MLNLAEVESLRSLSQDGRLLFGTRMVRMFAYGLLSVVLALYLVEVVGEERVGAVLTFTLLGDAAISLWITTMADRIGRRRMLMAGAGLMILAGFTFAVSTSFVVLVLAAIVGTISPSGNEVGPFLSIEQAALSHIIPDTRRTSVFAWYNLSGSLATATGALAGGTLAQSLQSASFTALDSYRVVLLVYAALGGILIALFSRVSPAVEVADRPAISLESRFGLHRSRNTVFRLSALFALDAFAGGMVIQSFLSLWFHQRYGVDEALIGAIFFGANILAGLSALAAARIAGRFGLINTMVFTHIPSNVLLIVVPLMPNLALAIAVLLIRFSISQMDVPTRQSYTMAVVAPDERSAAAGITSIVRSVGTALSQQLTGQLFAASLLSWPFFLAGGLKIVYDLLLYRSFRVLKPPEETTN
jgi:predicted MFS family arabinose efflux permease